MYQRYLKYLLVPTLLTLLLVAGFVYDAYFDDDAIGKNSLKPDEISILMKSNIPSPVELSSFNSIVNTSNVTLNWSTSSEENNSGFEVHRMRNNEWVNVGFINGNGNSASVNNYSFEDRNLNSGKYNYRLKQIDYNGNFKFYDLENEVVVGVPDKYSLSQNYPNPFNPNTTIKYDLPKAGVVTVKIYDVNGREMRTLLNENKEAGYYTIQFNASDLSSGVYFYRIQSADFVSTKKMVLLK